ncbi:DUF5994 family protein [Streptomyces sp. NPDC013171]|uniref:DUF5994 family protein n=1 Tax=Streptomyces sp. NPDC013171 TaxID=3364863 RepID=UPI0036CDD0B2
MAESDSPLCRSSFRTRSTERSGPGTDLLRRQAARSLEGVLDGAWWPGSRDVATELSALVEVLTPAPQSLTDVGLDTHARQDPHHPWLRRPLRPLGSASGQATRLGT